MADFRWHTPIEIRNCEPLEDLSQLNAYETVFLRMREEIDEFIVEAIRPYCEEITRIRISKGLLERALREYLENHPEEREGR